MTLAYVNHGRWVAECATPGCPGAERKWPGFAVKETTVVDPLTGNRFTRLFGISADGWLHCANCGQLSRVQFPSEADQIEEVLSMRPVPETRNWMPGETLADLTAENEAHGVGV